MSVRVCERVDPHDIMGNPSTCKRTRVTRYVSTANSAEILRSRAAARRSRKLLSEPVTSAMASYSSISAFFAHFFS